jgi:hypothetical protein
MPVGDADAMDGFRQPAISAPTSGIGITLSRVPAGTFCDERMGRAPRSSVLLTM